jgi:L-amino acid N-acyltransferase YncA
VTRGGGDASAAPSSRGGGAAGPWVRPARSGDVDAIARIYGTHVENGTGSFEERPPDPEELARRLQAIVARGLPYLVAEDGGRIAGFAYAGPFRTRSAYRFTVEDSVYVAHDAIGRGIGRLLLTELIGNCAADGYRQMVALIGDSENRASIGLHRSLGFRDAGTLAAVGYKFDRWLDVVFMQRTLGSGDRLG